MAPAWLVEEQQMKEIHVSRTTSAQHKERGWTSLAKHMEDTGGVADISLRTRHTAAYVYEKLDGTYVLVMGSRVLFNRWMRLGANIS